MSAHKVRINREHNALKSSLETLYAHFKWPTMIVFPLNYLIAVHTSNYNSSTRTHIKRHTYVTLGRLLLPLYCYSIMSSVQTVLTKETLYIASGNLNKQQLVTRGDCEVQNFIVHLNPQRSKLDTYRERL